MEDIELDQLPGSEVVEEVLQHSSEEQVIAGQIDNQTLDQDLKRLAKLDRYKGNTELRQSLAKIFTVIIAFWLVCIILILVGNNKKYILSDSVLITLLTTTTIKILGMMIIILWDLFPGKNGNKNKNRTTE